MNKVDPRSLLSGEEIMFLGIDISKTSFDAVLLEEKPLHRAFTNDPNGRNYNAGCLKQLLLRYTPVWKRPVPMETT